MTTPKPAHLGPRYAAQFGDRSVVTAYRHRPPYPIAVGDVLATIAGVAAPSVLEIGCGSGDLTRLLVGFAGHVDAVEPSAPMREAFERRALTQKERVRLLPGAAETVELHGPYELAVAGESLHWTEWEVTLPRIGAVLRPSSSLAIVERTQAPVPCEAEILALVVRYSTNREYEPYGLVDELTSRGLFVPRGRTSIDAVPVTQTVEEVIASIHSRNGFSRDRMRPSDARAFDHALGGLLRKAFPDERVTLHVGARIAWGAVARR